MKLFFLTFLASTMVIPAPIKIGTSEWEGYSEEETGKGIYQEILRAIFSKEDYEIKFFPWKRVENYLLTKSSEIDIGMCDFVESWEGKDYLLSKYFLSNDSYSVIHKKETLFKNANSFSGKLVSWQRGYKLDKFFDKSIKYKFTEVSKNIQGFQMVKFGRVDFYITEIEEKNFKELKRSPSGIVKGCHLIRINNKKNKDFLAKFDQGMKKLVKNGELEKIIKKIKADINPYKKIEN